MRILIFVLLLFGASLQAQNVLTCYDYSDFLQSDCVGCGLKDSTFSGILLVKDGNIYQPLVKPIKIKTRPNILDLEDGFATRVSIYINQITTYNTEASVLAFLRSCVAVESISIGDVTTIIHDSLSTIIFPIDSTNVIAGTGISVTQSPENTFTVTNTGDLSNTNELQTLDVTGTTTATLNLSSDATDPTITGAGISTVSVSGNAITITSTEVDGSTTNEIQDLSLSGNTLSLSGDPTTVNLSPYLDNTDNQTLSIIDSTNRVFTVGISGGNTIKFKDRAGIDSTIVTEGFGIIVTEPSTNTYNVAADTSKIATQHDLTTKVKGHGVPTRVAWWASTDSLSSSPTLYWDVPNDELEIVGIPISSNATNQLYAGVGAATGATGADNSNFIGPNAGSGATDAFNSNFIGPSAGYGATDAAVSNFIGNSAGYGATYANTSNFIGDNAGRLATGASGANFLGSFAGSTASNAYNSNFLGNQAGYGATNAYRSNFIGNNTGKDAVNAHNSNFFGASSGFGALNSSYSNFFGAGTGGPGLGTNNIIIGKYLNLPDSSTNAMNIGGVLFGTGFHSGIGQITNGIAGGKIGLLTNAPTQELHVDGNLRVEDAIYDSNNEAGASGQILSSTATGTDWVTPSATVDSTSIIGGWGIDATESPTNTFNLIVDSTQVATQHDLTSKVEGSGVATRVAFWDGAKSLSSNSNLYWDNINNRLGIKTASPSTELEIVGRAKILTSYGNNLFLNGGNTTFSGGENIAMGLNSGYSLSSGAYNTYIGNGSGYSNTTGSHNFGLGFQSLYNSTSQFNIAIGYSALRSSQGSNVGIGYEAGTNASGVDNLFLGFQTGLNAVSKNVMIGSYSGQNAGSENIAFGHASLQGFANNSIAIGIEALKLGGSNNIALGYLSLGSINTASTNNIAIGEGSLRFINGNQNVAIGPFSGDFSSGSGNVFLGYSAGRFIGGGNKLAIDNSDTSSPLIGGQFDNNRVGINTNVSSLSQTLDITGTMRLTGSDGTSTTIMGRDPDGDVSAITVSTGLSLTGNVLTSTGSNQYLNPYIQGADTTGFYLTVAQDTVVFISGAASGEATTVGDTPTIDLTLTGVNITADVKNGSITPAKLDRVYAAVSLKATTTTFATSSTTEAEWTGGNFRDTIDATGYYKVELYGSFISDAATTGGSYSIYNASVTDAIGILEIGITNNTGTATIQRKAYQNMTNESITGSAVFNTTDKHVLYGQLTAQFTSGDIIIPKFASEIAASTVTYQAGTRLIITKLF